MVEKEKPVLFTEPVSKRALRGYLHTKLKHPLMSQNLHEIIIAFVGFKLFPATCDRVRQLFIPSSSVSVLPC
jgi:hypothetical protein